jgi:hypothetical protein
VLIDPVGQPGANNRPADTAPATCHTVTPITTNRAATAAVAASIAATASAHTEPAGSGRAGSDVTAHSSRVNQPRTASVLEPNRRSHPRTVPNGRPRSAAIGRAPDPAALPAIAAPTTSTASARRSRNPTGNSTCVTRHREHTARRGRTDARPDPVRITRARAWPHRTSTPPQPGHASSPATSRRSTTAASAPTVNTRCLRAPPRGPPEPGQGSREGRCRQKPHQGDDEQQEGQPARVALNQSSRSTTPTGPYVLIQNAREQPAPQAPIVGEAPAIRTSPPVFVPPQNTSAVDDLVERYSRLGGEGSREGRRGPPQGLHRGPS